MKCPQCRSENPADSRFCSRCGTKITPSGKINLPKDAPHSLTKEFKIGSTFAGRYMIIEELGKGGMGTVYKVLDKEVDEKIALKLLNPDVAANERTITRFRNELKTARKISHKNVCRIYDLSKGKGIYYITMEYVPGDDLKHVVRMMGQLGIGKALFIAKQVCEGLAQAHKKGIVHRDLKPQNIMLDRDGNARIMDFGIARSLETKGVTDTGMMIGTPEYMSPEQVEGKEADFRSDIYSLGVIVYEMVTGRIPFDGETALSIALKHKNEVPRDPRELNDKIPEALSLVILRCMEKASESRYQKAEELLSELDQVEKNLPASERFVPVEEPEAEEFEELEETREEESEDIEVKKSIAVLPFADLSLQKDQEYYCDGMAEEIINALTGIEKLRVVARNSSFSFKESDLKKRKIGRTLYVETLLDGRVRRVDRQLNVIAQLIKVSDGSKLWSKEYERKLSDVFAIQDEILLEIMKNLDIKLHEKEKKLLLKHHPDDLEAYDLYLRGRSFLNKEIGKIMEKALLYFKGAIKIAPDYAQAYAGLALSYIPLGLWDYMPPKDVYPEAKKAAEKAIQIDGTLTEAHYSLGVVKMLYDWDWKGAERELKEAIKLSPNYAEAHDGYAAFLSAIGKKNEAIVEAEIAVDLDPLSWYFNANLGMYLLRAGRQDEAKQRFRKILSIGTIHPHMHRMMGQAYLLDSKYDVGLAEIRKGLDMSGNNPMILGGLGWGYAVAGQTEEAKKVLEELNKRSEGEYIRPYYFAQIYSGLGEKDLAFKWLVKAFEQSDISLATILVDETLDNLRSDNRFNLILKKMELV
ncbi:MAG: protein kinase [Candidatus Aminicenantes bacterium]|nr:protein kinase [Candidatus Aminicenantes bacterium]